MLYKFGKPESVHQVVRVAGIAMMLAATVATAHPADKPPTANSSSVRNSGVFQNLCDSDDAVVFSCKINKKSLSLCKVGPSAIQYRFGGFESRPELVITASAANASWPPVAFSKDSFDGETHSSSFAVEFNNASARYSLSLFETGGSFLDVFVGGKFIKSFECGSDSEILNLIELDRLAQAYARLQKKGK